MTGTGDGVAWITGASSGIGRALALRLARDGRTVAASARSAGALSALAAEAGAEAEAEGRIVPFPLDVTDAGAVAAAADVIERRLGPVGLAVLNAGTHTPMGLDDFSAATARALMEVNYFGVVHALDALLPRLAARGGGRVAVVASVAGYRGLPTAAAYGPTKAALINLCEALKPECDRAGIRLHLINPGFVDTPLTARNPFPMPDIIPAAAAADRIADGLAGDRFEIAFPPRFARTLKLARCLPYRAYFALVRRVTGT
ncbi:SDR family NAD(P)-dependent oxidoreductase [Azospirillum halopraeferens]|uniref:SDR family NAD(P)-dependent oxidoreductase n=1 Tax=Azospirillum halopraeferens TaxID=34010 RepID=UPI0004291651|nr:SDR family NAD(P)-dependent oxidoreductase [Azospirillum halopraeferens]